MLVGRDQECQLIRALVAGARVGYGAALVLTGEAGIGKTALLEEAAATCGGMRLLRATGTVSESAVPFGALLQVLRPALGHLDRIPEPQAQALAAALALRPGAGGDRFAVGAATLSLLSRFAEDEPVAVILDDAHLLDGPSAQALTFAGRRLGADPVLLLAAVRTGEPAAMTVAGLPVLPVGGLPPAAAVALLGASSRRLPTSEAARLCEATGGNPLALLELADDLGGLPALPSGAPVPVPASLARTFARRADRLSEPARIALLVAAAGSADLAGVARACGLLGVPVTALEEAEDAALLTVAGRTVVFRHPLVRAAVYAEAAPGRRRSVHRALAAGEDDVDRRAWHLAEAALGPDEDTAQALESAALRARCRSAHAVAAAAFLRGADLTPGSGDRARRLLAGAECAWLAGAADQTGDALDRMHRLGPFPELDVRAAALRGTVAARTGRVEEARDVLMAAGAGCADDDADTAIRLLAEAILACLFLGDAATVAAAAERIDRLLDGTGGEPARWIGAMACGVAGVLTGHGGPERIRRAVRLGTPADPASDDRGVVPWLVLGPLFLRERVTGRALVATVLDELRRRTAVAGLPFLLFQVGRDQATTDRWAEAEISYTEGITLARETGHVSDQAACLAGLAWLEARQGREDACRAHAVAALEICRSRHLGLFEAWSLFALGELELAQGRPEAAVEQLEQLGRLLEDLRLADVDVSPVPELVEALMHLGRRDAAREAAVAFARRAEDKGQPWALARAARAQALVGPDVELDELFARALEHHARTPDAFELARTQLLFGACLRRARRRADARQPLRASLSAFDALGATPWAEQAAAELRATGETVQRREPDARRDLTPQELQIATMLAAGRTTRETAAALFLSPKTVEYHLRHVYLKLGVSSRDELAVRLPPRS